ncbi:unnamed protein product, partial [Larinioides sclopetarius]
QKGANDSSPPLHKYIPSEHLLLDRPPGDHPSKRPLHPWEKGTLFQIEEHFPTMNFTPNQKYPEFKSPTHQGK